MNLHILQQIKDQLINDPKFAFFMKHYMYGHNDVTFTMDKAMKFDQLKEILDSHGIEKKYDIDSFIDGNEFNGLKITYLYVNPRTYGKSTKIG
jgi:hypothetical protein